MRQIIVIILSAALFTACQSGPRNWTPVIDTQGVELDRYNLDLADCLSFSDQVDAGQATVEGAAAGAVLGGVTGGIAGDSSRSAARGAGIGTVFGGVRGSRNAAREQNRIVRNCLTGRGYRVLN